MTKSQFKRENEQIRDILKQCLNSSEVVSYRNYFYGDTHVFEFVNYITVSMQELSYRGKLSYRFYLSMNGDIDNAHCLNPKNKVYEKELKLLQIGMLHFLEKKEEKGEIARSTLETKKERKKYTGYFLNKLFSNNNTKELVMKEHPTITITDEHKVEISAVKFLGSSFLLNQTTPTPYGTCAHSRPVCSLPIYGDDQHWVKITNIVAPIVSSHILEKTEFPRVTVTGNVLSIIDVVTWVGGGRLQYQPHYKIVKSELYIGKVMLISDYEKHLSKIRLGVTNMRQFYSQTEKRLKAEDANWKETVII